MDIKSIRKKLSLTQTQFARQLGVSFATVNRWENKRHIPSKLAQEKMEEWNRFGLQPKGNKPCCPACGADSVRYQCARCRQDFDV